MRSVQFCWLIVCLFAVPIVLADSAWRERLDNEGIDAALPALSEAAAAGDAQAATLLASLYQRGEGVPKSFEKAIELYTLAADAGDAEAQFNLGNIHLLGEGVKADDAWALTWYRKAAAQGHELAQRNLEQLYQAAGIEAPLTPPEEPQETAPEPAVTAVAALDAEPLAPTRDLDAAPTVEVAEAAAVGSDKPAGNETDKLNDDERAAIELARQHGVDIVAAPAPPEPETSTMADADDSTPASLSQVEAPIAASEHVADAISIQTPTPPISAPGVAETSGSAAAAYNEARDFLAAQQVDQAIAALERAAAGGHAQAQFDLATRYLLGAGVKPDDAMAITLLRDAARNGHNKASERLRLIYADAGLPMPDFQRPRMALKPGGDEAAQGAAVAPTTPADELQSAHAKPAAVVAANASPEGSVSTASPEDTRATPSAAPEVAPSEPRQAYRYAVVDHEAASPEKPDIAAINPPRPANHAVIAGGALAQTRVIAQPAPEAVASPQGLAADELLAEPETPMTPIVETDEVAANLNEEMEETIKLVDEADLALSGTMSGASSATTSEVISEPSLTSTAVGTAAEEQLSIDQNASTPASTVADVAATAPAGALPVAELSGFDEDTNVVSAAEEDTEQAAASVGAIPAATAAAGPSRRGVGALEATVTADTSTAGQTESAEQDLKTVEDNAVAQAAPEDQVTPAPPEPQTTPAPSSRVTATLADAKAALERGDYALAAEQFAELATAGNAEAQAHYGYMLYQGEGVERNKAAAVDWYRKSAVQGNRDAQYNLAVAYAFGEGAPQDDAEAAVWYRRAAEQGSAIAQYSLAVSYALGEGLSQSDSDALGWYRAAAEQGYPAAQYNLAYMYRAGKGVERDDEQALHWFLIAAENGHASAQYALGYMYRSGKGVARDIDEATRWYRLAAAQGHAEARADLASLAPAN